MATHVHITGAASRARILHPVLPQLEASSVELARPLSLSSADRAWLGDTIETLLAILDHADGDADLEDTDLDRCLAADDGCGPIADPELDALWRAAA